MSAGNPRSVLFAALVCAFAVAAYSYPAVAVEPTSPGLHDLVVFDPGVHDRGLPAVRLEGHKGGRMTVDIPPAVHVHRYFYSGDKEFQGPIISGGPTVVVANHPKTGERTYIDVVLPAGAPRIAYNKHGITYVYSDRRVQVKFSSFPRHSETAVIKNHSGRGFGRNLHDAHKHVSAHIKESMSNSQLVQSIKGVGQDTGQVIKGTGASVGAMTSAGADGIKSLTNLIPGVVYLRSLAEQKPQRDYEATIRAAERKGERELPDYVRTNR